MDSPSPSSPTSPHPYQHLSDADHCIPPSSSSPSSSSSPPASVFPPGRARSGSRTYREVQEDERRAREVSAERERERKRAEAADALEGRKSSEGGVGREAPGSTEEAMSMTELRAEMETLLSLRRRSMSQPAALDPDLPPTSPPTSAPPVPSRPQLTLTITPPTDLGPGGAPISPTAPSPAETGTLVRRKSSVSGRLPSEHPLPIPPVPSPTSPSHPHTHSRPQVSPPLSSPGSSYSPTSPSPFAPSEAAHSAQQADLFWLPASLHPELAPQEFKAFIREQTTPEALARRSSLSPGGGGRGAGGRMSRRASLLRGEYKPRQDDGVGENEGGVGGVKRTASDGGAGRGSRRSVAGSLNFEELTIKDLQRLEELAAKAESEGAAAGSDLKGEGERLGRVLRRSLSLNPHRVAAAAAAAGATFGSGSSSAFSEAGAPGIAPPPGMEDATISQEAPLIVPPPGQILRRNARTKIRKGSLDTFGTGFGGGAGGGGGGSRFGSRRTRSSTSETGVQLAPSVSSYGGGSTEDDALSVGDVSFESAESEEVRTALEAATARAAAAEQQHHYAQQVEETPTVQISPPSSDSQHQHLSSAQEQVDYPHQHQYEPQPLPLDHLDEKPLPRPVPEVVLDYPVDEGPAPPAHDSAVLPGPPAVAPVADLPSSSAAQFDQSDRHAISPASAEYDWSTHNLHFQQQQQQHAPPAPVEPQYTVHPGHSPRQPFSDVPPPQPVAIPQPLERKDSASSTASSSPPTSPRPDSPSPSTTSSKQGKEKKSGWARLGLGKEKDKEEGGKKKGKGKEKAHDSPTGSGSEKGSDAASVHSHSEKESTGGGSGFFGGLFGRKRSESDHSPPAAPSPPPSAAATTAEARMPPPPPTASGALLPNGRYANFYRLPIHVERAVYRLSHIKLANPRRPLYEQVLISNLMFWYLGLIQKPVQPPPAAQPVPIPGMRNQQQQQQQQQQQAAPVSSHDSSASPSPQQQQQQSAAKRVGLSKPSLNRSGGGGGNGNIGRSAEMPVRTPSYEVQNQQLNAEQQRQQLSQSHPQPSSSSIAKSLFAAPLSSSSNSPSPPHDKSRSPDRTSAPAQMYPAASRTPQNSVEDDDDDRPLASLPHHQGQQQQQQQPYRESYPPNAPRPAPIPVSSYSGRDAGFQVTSRNSPRLSGGGSSDGGHSSPSSSFAPLPSSPSPTPPTDFDPNTLITPSSGQGQGHDRRLSAVSTMSDKSFDAGEIFDAYAAPGSPAGGAAPELPPVASVAPPPPAPARTTSPSPPAQKAPLLGTVAPRGSSLRALVGGGDKKKQQAAVGVFGASR